MNTNLEERKIGRFRRSVILTKSAWNVLRLDKELLTLPLIGTLISLPIIVLAVIGSILVEKGRIVTISQTNNSEYKASWHFIAVFMVTGLLIGIVANFIAVAVSRAALDRFEGKDPTVRGSLVAARARMKAILLFTMLSTGIGLVLSVIRDRVPFAGKVLTWIGDTAWAVASFFVIPMIAHEEAHIGPISATKRSIGLIRRVWGESLIVNLGISLIALLSFVTMSMVGVAATIGATMVNTALGFTVGALSVLGMLVLVIIFSVLSSIAKTAVYYWAETGVTPETFNKDLMRQAFTPKKARRLFS